jgi:hypothetical protein
VIDPYTIPHSLFGTSGSASTVARLAVATESLKSFRALANCRKMVHR